MDQNDLNMNCTAEDADISNTQNTITDELSSPDAIYDKSQSLVDIANNTFRELSKTLESEQNKLIDLEERRKKLQEEMQHLKAEIEEEKKLYQMNLVQSVTENLRTLDNETANQYQQKLENQPVEICNEEEDGSNTSVVNNQMTDESTIEEQTIHIKIQLQNVLEQCIFQQSQPTESDGAASSKTELKSIED